MWLIHLQIEMYSVGAAVLCGCQNKLARFVNLQGQIKHGRSELHQSNV